MAQIMSLKHQQNCTYTIKYMYQFLFYHGARAPVGQDLIIED